MFVDDEQKTKSVEKRVLDSFTGKYFVYPLIRLVQKGICQNSISIMTQIRTYLSGILNEIILD